TRFFFSQTSGLRKEDIPTSFMPIRPNPYIVGNPVRNPRMFFGRQEERRFIAGKLLGREEGSVIVLTGERRTGKTSILYQILEGSLGEEFFPVFLDMQSLLVESDMEFLSAILDRIQETLSCNNLPSEEILNQGTPFISFTGILGQLFETIPSKKIVFLIDEYELIESRIKEGKLSSDLPAYLSSLLEANPRLSLILTGSQKLSANPLWSPLLAKSYYREISFLKRPDAEELILAPLRGYVVFEGSTIEGVLRLTSGHPFYTQLVLQTLVDVINENQAIRIDRTLLEETKQRIADHPPPQLLYAWEGFSQEEKLVLTGLSTLLKTERSYAQSERIHRVLSSIPDRYRGEQDEVETRIILESLRQRGVLDRDQTRYRFKMDLLRVWVRQEFSVWSLLKLGVEETLA
ncbi:MAG: AAA family ATPase, partial [Candidatus Bathyarchaeota archaeon]|nr:AAA family ATPase [Candidatus Bathyarchaeota archaeon]